jgi:filamentous hemagglutinin
MMYSPGNGSATLIGIGGGILVNRAQEAEAGAPATLIGEMPTDTSANWIHAGTTSDGKPILTQVTAQADPERQSAILASYNSVGKDQVPSVFSYDRPEGSNWGYNITGPFTQLKKTHVEFMRNTTPTLLRWSQQIRGG